jgi:TfoX/Sxy family transcriptional regulator of competence genes
MAYDPNLAQRVATLLAGDVGCVEKKMFGGVGFLLNGNMACGVLKDQLIVRVGPDAYAAALHQKHVRPFDITGREMRGWVMVAAPGIATEAALNSWVRRGFEFAASLPPK